ncbi:Protein yippee-like protein, partial [Cucurbita argyrosperma subsp. sororia]
MFEIGISLIGSSLSPFSLIHWISTSCLLDFWVTIEFIVGGEANHVALHDDIISKAFQGRHGRAFLFSHAMNITVGPKEDRHLMTGLHTVADVHCVDCREVLGWKYERAYEASQKYKEGKFILEKSKIVRDNW